jgi:hypothetical protein
LFCCVGHRVISCRKEIMASQNQGPCENIANYDGPSEICQSVSSYTSASRFQTE